MHGEVKAYDRNSAARLGRYMIRCPLVLERLSLDQATGDPTGLGSAAGISTALPPADDEPFRRRARLTWAALIKNVYETDPLLCPSFGAEMKIIAFITEHPTVRRILEHIRMPPQRPEPLAHSPPLQDELLYA
ncbi:MAG: hypothetical protein ACE5HV_15725 [Acidobacteriota bacterium]